MGGCAQLPPLLTLSAISEAASARVWGSTWGMRHCNQHEPERIPCPLDMLILRTLERNKRQHGFEIASSIQERSENVLLVA